jgi:hypothetical protein
MAPATGFMLTPFLDMHAKAFEVLARLLARPESDSFLLLVVKHQYLLREKKQASKVQEKSDAAQSLPFAHKT